CRIQWSTDASPANPVHTVTVSGTPQRGGTFDLNAMPDALPALAVLACFAPAPIALTNVPQARQKETDRIAVMATELEKLGATIQDQPDGMKIEPKVLRGGTVDSHGDHRIAMALAIGALAATGPVTITDAGAAAVTYPAFYDDLARLAPGAV
ncbi:MAG: 3-phosphoshikimate 1-carboxyvinyltransferase, partial [Spirochaeta sp.]|nr:3-phosphoshikimate 1-carboxyvinyltransferase [Spirochaeta sp.]